MAELDLKSMRTRVDNATSGPWIAFSYDKENGLDCDGWDVQAACNDGSILIVAMPDGNVECGKNAVFIAHARQDIPALIERVVELEQELSFLKSKRPKRTPISTAQRFRILHRDSFTCQYCFRKGGSDFPLEIDHVVPMSKGGTNEDTNLKTACYDCNRGKRDMELNVK